MDCNEVRPLLSAAVDRELSAAEAMRVERHLTTCEQCRQEAQALQAVSRVTRAADYFRAPEALRERIVAALPVAGPAPAIRPTPPVADLPDMPHMPGMREEATGATDAAARTHARPGRRGPARLFAFGRPMGATVAAMGLVTAMALAVAGVALVSHRPAGMGTALIDELVESHVRAQLSGHDIDVVSSDQHTVKPWFNGRLDYAPPVQDLADDGFALTGGRLDYVDHRRVAVLVYRYRKHVIDVYVMPRTPAGANTPSMAPSSLTSDGYALASWRANGMLWWAISDAEPAVLARLRAALTARLGSGPPPTATPQ